MDSAAEKSPSPPPLPATLIGKTMRQRLFSTLVDDLREATFNFNAKILTEEEFLNHAEQILKNLRAFSSEGNVQNVLSRAEIVILDGVCKDVGT